MYISPFLGFGLRFLICLIFSAVGLVQAKSLFPNNAHEVLSCVSDAANYHQVDPKIVVAIAWVESRFNPSAKSLNENGTSDYGVFQINSVHNRSLSRFGMSANDLHDPCISAYVASWLYAKQVRRYGSTWEAVGAYHSQTPHYQKSYANRVAKVMMDWGWIPTGALPFPN